MSHNGGGAAYPRIRDYSWQKRRDYLVLVAAVAASDGELHPDELSLLRKWMDEFRLGDSSRRQVEAAARNQPVPKEKLERRLANSGLAYSLMLDMMGMAMADGFLMDEEIDHLRAVSDRLGIDPIHFDILIEFVHAAYQAAQLTNPEPLYEHSIDSAFELLWMRGVQLFPHTLLCVSDATYDRQLKERWQSYQQRRNRDHAVEQPAS